MPGPQPLLLCLFISLTSDEARGEVATGRQQEDQVAWLLNPCHTLFISGLKGFLMEKQLTLFMIGFLFLWLLVGWGAKE